MTEIQITGKQIVQLPEKTELDGNEALVIQDSEGSKQTYVNSISEENFTTLEKQKLNNILLETVYTNICKLQNIAWSNLSLSYNSDGSVTLEYDKQSNEWKFINYLIDKNIYWKQNHTYYVALNCLVLQNSLTDTEDSSGGNNVFAVVAKYDDPTSLSSIGYTSSIITGQKGIIYTFLSIDRTDNTVELYPNSNRIFIQFGNFETEDYFSITIYDIILIDLGENVTDSYKEYINSIVINNMLGDNFIDSSYIINNCLNAVNAKYAQTAEIANRLATGKDIECWGDSLTAQDYGKHLSQILGRNCFNHGYGGKKSTYIRDQFLLGFNSDRTQIIWVGRNNYSQPDVIIDDIRDMITAFGKLNFIIMTPPNGNFGDFGTEMVDPTDGTGEMKGGGSYNKFIELTDKLAKEYPSNFLDIREASIFGWRMGNIKLLKSFIKPELNNSVQISVSDANFLTTYNSNDENKFGNEFMSHIRIGLNGKYDKYKVISKDSDTLLTIQLVESNYLNSGETVDNLVDDGGTNSTIYLRVMQEADYMCHIYDTTLSTFRSDGIHMSEDGKKLIAEIVARKIIAMGI